MIDYDSTTIAKRKSLANLFWFSLGFVVALVLLAIFFPTVYSDGIRIYRMPLWENYLHEFRFQFRTPRYLGAKPDGFGELVSMFTGHILRAAVGGLVMLAIAVVTRKFSSKTGPTEAR